MSKHNPFVSLLVIAAVVVAFVMIPRLSRQTSVVKEYEYYNEFIADLDAGKIETIQIIGSKRVEGKFQPGAFGDTKESLSRYKVEYEFDAQTIEQLRAKYSPPVDFAVSAGSWTDNLLGWVGTLIFPIAILLFFWIFILRQMRNAGGQAFNFGRSQAKLLGENLKRVTFGEVAGMEEVKEELQEVVQFLKDPERFRSLGAKIPRGVLLVGPPGCGKTLLARAVAGEADVAFFYMSGSDFVEMFVGVGASRVRDLFREAKQHLPAIIFIDELDAVGRLRGAGLGGGHDEREQTLNALLVEMDGFDPNADIIILAATNRPDILDPALLRPGRFDRQVIVPNPDVREREAILDLYMKDKPMAEEVDASILAKRTPGFSGADLENLVNEGALLAARLDKKEVGMPELDEAVERVLAGPQRKSRVMSADQRKVLAYHEGGHALVGNMLPDFDKTYKVTILPRGMALGYTLNLPEDDRYMMFASELSDQLVQALGGRAAEQLVFGDITTGAANDLQRVSKLAREMVTDYGMSDELGPITYGHHTGPVFLGKDFAEERNYSEDAAEKIDREVRRLVDEAYQRALEILGQHRDKLELLVEALLEHETLAMEQVEAIVERGELPQQATEAPAEEPASIHPEPEPQREETKPAPGVVPHRPLPDTP